MIEEVFEYNQFFVAVMNIINFSRLCPPKEGHRHHIIPKCWFKLHNLPIDNSEDNLVLVSYENHLKLHKLYTKCMKEKIMKSKMACAYTKLGGKTIENSYFSGDNNPFYGKHHSEEIKEKLSEIRKHHPNLPQTLTTEMKTKISEKTSKRNMTMNVGRKWYTDGKINKFCYECPDGFQPGMAYRKRGNKCHKIV